MKIRAATIDDAEVFAQVGKETFALATPPGTLQKDIDSYVQAELSREKFAESIQSPDKTFFAAEVDEKVVGYLMLSRGEGLDGVKGKNPLEVQRIYVLQHYHGKGVAKAFMEQAIAYAVANNHDTIWLGVSKHNPRGLAFYGKHGFIQVGETTFRVGDDIHEDLVLERAAG